MDYYKTLLVLMLVFFVRELNCQKSGQLRTSMCPSGWTMVYKAQQDTAFRLRICIKSFEDLQVTWPEAEATCRNKFGRLVDMENMLYLSRSSRISNDKFNLNTSEFWSGIHRRSKYVLTQDGFPPVKAEDKHFRFLPWAKGEPRDSQEQCVAVKSYEVNNTTSYNYEASMTSCDRKLPFYCFTDLINTVSEVSTCPAGYVGNYQWELCYKVHHKPGNYKNVDALCAKDGDVIAVMDPSSTSASFAFVERAGGMFYKFPDGPEGSGSELSTLGYYVKSTESTQQGCPMLRYEPGGDFGAMGFLTFTSCDNVGGVICQRKQNQKVKQEKISIKIQSVYTSQKQLRGINRFSQQPITCSLSRPLTDIEVVVFTYLSAPLGSPYTVDINQFRNVTSISVPKADPFLSVGEYSCWVVHKALTSYIAPRDKVYVKFVDKEYLIFRGSIGVNPAMRGEDNFMKFNYGLTGYSKEVSSIGTSLNNSLQSALTSVRMMFLEGILKNQENDIMKSTDKSVDRISNAGSTFEFSIFVTLKELNTWYNLKNDQFLLQLITTNLKSRLSNLEVSRKKRQTFRLDPNKLNIKSTASCRSRKIYNADLDKTLFFEVSAPNQVVPSSENCITDRQPLATATCTGSLDTGYSLTNITINNKCVFSAAVNSSVTNSLQSLSQETVNEKNSGMIISDTANLTSAEDLISRDVIYTAEILDNVAELQTITEKDFQNVVTVVSNIIRLSENVLSDAQNTGSATSRILEALETVASKLSLQPGTSKMIIEPSFAIQVRDIANSSDLIVGLQLDATGQNVINKDDLQILDKEEDVVIGNTGAAIILPVSVIKANNRTKLHMQIYASTKLFIQKGGNSRYELNGKVAAATIIGDNGQPIKNLGNERVKTIFKPIKDNDNQVCAFWDYKLYNAAGGWSTEGCELQRTEKGRAICVCDHLTNFAILIDFGDKPIDPDHDKALSIISIVGLVLSIIGLSLTVLSFIVFRQLRKGNAQKTLFNLALAMLISWVVFLAGIKQTSSYGGCIAVAAILHYLILVTFMWMLVEGLLQYLRFVKVLGTYIPRFILKATIIAWAVPIIPVIIVLAIDYDLYWGGKNYCWMSLTPLYYAFALPVGLIIVTNIIVFGLIIYNLVNRPKGLQTNQSEYKRMMMNFWAALSAFVLLGITWIFGFFAISDARIVFLYLFTILNVLQGLFIFLLFTFREPQVRNHWRNKLCGKRKSKYASDSSSASREKLSKTNQSGTQFTDLSSISKNNSVSS